MISRRSLLLGIAAFSGALISAPAFAEKKKTTLVEIFRNRQGKPKLGAAIQPTGKRQVAAAVPGQKPAKSKAAKQFTLDPKYEPQVVKLSGYKPGTIVIDSRKKFLYLVETPQSARRYGVAVGREGLGWTGKAKIGNKTEWPRWIPTADMIARDPKQYAQYADGMDGGPENPLGARAMYLTQGGKDTYIRIHGTTQPWSIGKAASNGCFRMVNEHVIDLYARVKLGTEVVVK